MLKRSMMFTLSWGALSLAPVASVDLPAQLLPVYGGPGGTAFTRSCGTGRVLTGLRTRVGLVIDAVGVLCRPVNSNGTLGSETTRGTHAGSGGGSIKIVRCRAGEVVSGAQVAFGSYVDRILMSCQPWTAASRTVDTARFNRWIIVGNVDGGTSGTEERCESPAQPANGIRGRATAVVDAIGFICNEP